MYACRTVKTLVDGCKDDAVMLVPTKNFYIYIEKNFFPNSMVILIIGARGVGSRSSSCYLSHCLSLAFSMI